MKCLFIGRFQPFHQGHLQDIKDALAFSEEVRIGIGSSQESGTEQNPFSYAQRKEMISRALEDEGISLPVFPVPDINNDDEWVEHVRRSVPAFDVVYTGNPLTRKLFEKAGIPVREVRMLEGVSGTTVRELMQSGKDWKKLVPPAVAEYLERM